MNELLRELSLEDRQELVAGSVQGSCLEDEEAGVEDAGVDEGGTEVAALEELVGGLEEEVVGVEHDDPVVRHQAPRVELVQRQLESGVEVALLLVRVLQVLHGHHLHPVLLLTVVYSCRPCTNLWSQIIDPSKLKQDRIR
ncbi:hypothetical protein MUK42_28462 [Musa troglodytarum]|uniref:Uncharacterized protein n=1 Tax=Musa troglodytarum TaxID=320322 RepID=A0A9E7K1N5_9LILI|nr:hypothetical protein MUK42_28462 [Musa troglodytarum]